MADDGGCHYAIRKLQFAGKCQHAVRFSCGRRYSLENRSAQRCKQFPTLSLLAVLLVGMLELILMIACLQWLLSRRQQRLSHS